MKKALLAAFMALLLVCTGCMDGEAENKGVGQVGTPTEGEWLVEIYFCGSDLESEDGAVTRDLAELAERLPPDNVTFVIETGGSKEWQNEVVKPNEIGRYLYDKDGFQKLEALPDADMGSGDTFADFLDWAGEFEADHRVLIVWNHGGGTVAGACHDERTENMMTLNEMQDAMAKVYDKDESAPPFDIIGFDACLMATYGTANNFLGYGRYLVASQESEPAVGWDYDGIIDGFHAGVGSDPAVLGRVICDSYLKGCEDEDVDLAATLSVVDLSRLPALTAAYEKMGEEALAAAKDNPKQFFASYAREADGTTNFGPNSKDSGFTNMIDMGVFARHTKDLLPETSDAVLDALDRAVVYQVKGFLNSNAGGLSCYYPYDKSQQQEFEDVRAASPHYKSLYKYFAGGTLQGMRTLKFDISLLEDHPIGVDRDGAVYCDLTQAQMDELASVRCNLLYYDVESNIFMMLGSDANVNADWETGHFTDNFDGTWPMLAGHPIHIEVTEIDDDFVHYLAPIKLNGRKVYLQIAYDYDKEKYIIIGATEGLNAAGASGRNAIKLKAGDTVTTLMMGAALDDTDNIQQVEAETFKLQPGFAVADEELGDGTYAYCFEFTTPTDEYALSDIASYKIVGGNITTSTDMQ